MRNPFEIYTTARPHAPRPKELSWEEASLEGGPPIEGFSESVDKKSSAPWVLVAVALCFGLLVFQLARLQLGSGSHYRALAEGNRLREQLLLAPRGFIKDRYGDVLVQNTVSFRLVAVPLDLPKDGLAHEVSSLSTLLSLNETEVLGKLETVNRSSFEPVVVAQDLSKEQTILFETRASEFVGFHIQSTPIREYPSPEVFSHLIGYAGIISDGELEQAGPKSGLSLQDYIGKIGIEKQYEQYLRGQNGHEQIEVNASGQVIKTLGTVSPRPGNIVELNVDRQLQEVLYASFTQKGAKGAAIAMNPKTGEVLSLLSLPGFNNNLFARGIKHKEYQELLENKSLPLFNRAVSGTYPPGSTVKPMVTLAALAEGVVSEHTVIVDRGVLVIPNQYDPRISYNFFGWNRRGLGPMTARSAIAESSDIYFYTVSGGHPSSPIKPLGPEKLAEYYRKFNLGRVTGIDLGGEKPGVVADPAWKAEYFKDDAILKKWYLGDTYHIGIGQGDMLTTPLQVALWTAAIANNGVGYKPHLLKKVVTQEGQTLVESKSEELINLNLNQEFMKVAQEGMRQTIQAGSGRQLAALPISSAGKTGTSQFDGSDPSRTHAWFTAYAPFEDPEIVITVLVEAGGEGHAVAVPVVKEALSWWAEHRYGK